MNNVLVSSGHGAISGENVRANGSRENGHKPCTSNCEEKLSPEALAQYRARVLDSYALVTYLPSPMGEFFDDLSRSLVPNCKPRSHVTLLPPRRISGTEEEATHALRRILSEIPAFELQISSIEIFDITSVIYADIGEGRDRLMELHGCLNVDALYFEERFAYHPHVTLVIDAPSEAIPELAERARERWAQFPHSRRFLVEHLHFVHNTGVNQWEELGAFPLQVPAPAMR